MVRTGYYLNRKRKGIKTLYGSLISTPNWRTESYYILFWCTVYQWRRHVKGIAIIRRASILKHLWIYAWFAFFRCPILISATKWIKIESQASTFASNNFPILVKDFKFLRAQVVQVFRAASNGAFRRKRFWSNRNRKVVAINQANIKKFGLPYHLVVQFRLMWLEVCLLVHCIGAFHHSHQFHKPVANWCWSCNLSVPKFARSMSKVPQTRCVWPGWK